MTADGSCCGGELVGGDTANGLCLITGLPLAGLPGELCGLGGCVGLGAGAGRTGGLCDLGSGRMTLVVPPPSNTPESSNLLDSGSEVGSVACDRPPGGVESGLGGLGPVSDIFGDDGLTRSGEEVLVSATDSPRSG